MLYFGSKCCIFSSKVLYFILFYFCLSKVLYFLPHINHVSIHINHISILVFSVLKCCISADEKDRDSIFTTVTTIWKGLNHFNS
jgi:hypothetical protein